MAATCAGCGLQKADASPRVDNSILCDDCEAQQTRAKTASNDTTKTGDKLTINELLCFVQAHMGRTTKENIAQCVGRFFSLDSVIEAKDVMSGLYDDCLSTKLKNRRGTSNRMKIDMMIDDIISAMVELDQKGIHTNFVARDILKLPKCDPKDIDPYTTLQRLLMLEDRVGALETDVGQNKAEAVMQCDDVRKLKQTVDTHETLISNNMLPSQPTYAALVASGPKPTQRHSDAAGPDGSKSRPDSNGGNAVLPPTHRGVNVQHGNRGRTQSQSQQLWRTSQSAASSDAAGPQTSDGGGDQPWRIVGRNGKPHSGRQRMQGAAQGVSTQGRQRIQGRAQSATVQGAPPPKRDFFVSRVHRDTVDEHMKQYITDKGINSVELVIVSNPSAAFKSYKLSVPVSERPKILCADIWPYGVCVQKWRDRTANRDVRPATPQHGSTEHTRL